jgi:hypothetical protein
VEPLSPGRYRVQFTASADLRDKLERLTALMRSSVPDGDLGAIIEHAVTEKLERLEARRFAKTNAPRKTLADSDYGRQPMVQHRGAGDRASGPPHSLAMGSRVGPRAPGAPAVE